MIRNLKALGLAFILLALSAAATSAAEFHSELVSTEFVGNSIGGDVVTTTAGTVNCQEVTYTGSQLGATTDTVIVVPAFSGCVVFGFSPNTINVNGCEYELHGEATTVDIQGCNSASGIIVTAKLFGVTKCTMTFPEQAGLKGLTFTNSGTGTTREFTIDAAIDAEISYTHHAGSGAGACTNGSSGTGSYSGEALVTGSSGGSHVGIWYE